jgi:hypothetical protein
MLKEAKSGACFAVHPHAGNRLPIEHLLMAFDATFMRTIRSKEDWKRVQRSKPRFRYVLFRKNAKTKNEKCSTYYKVEHFSFRNLRFTNRQSNQEPG